MESERINQLEDRVRTGVVAMLRLAGRDPDEEAVRDTPRRVVKALREMTMGEYQRPSEILATTFAEKCDEMVVLRSIPFTSLCEHHLLPFQGEADVGYIPGERVVGLSKLARLVDCFARRLQIQERMTDQIADAIEMELCAKGVAVVVKATHSCMSCRGVMKSGASMVTSAMRGIVKDDARARDEFLRLIDG